MNLLIMFDFDVKSWGELIFFVQQTLSVWIQLFVRNDFFYANKFQEYWWISHSPFPLQCIYRVVYFFGEANAKDAFNTGVGQLRLQVRKQILHDTVAYFGN
jgi:hypothetical protein